MTGTTSPTVGLKPSGIPPRPSDLPPVQFTSDNARQVFASRYLRKDPVTGEPTETPEDAVWRVAYHVARAEAEWGADEEQVLNLARTFYHLLADFRFLPNSPTWTGAGTPLGQLAACFVLGLDDDMGREEHGIFETLRKAALIQQTGGGNGFSFSRLRPKNAPVMSSAGKATGPVGFLRVFDQAFGEIAQGGCLVPETLVFTDQGLFRLDELVPHQGPGWYEHEWHVVTHEGIRRSPAGYVHGQDRVIQVKTREGWTLTGTPNHKVLVRRKDGEVWVPLRGLKPGDRILVVLGAHRGVFQPLDSPDYPILDEPLAYFLGLVWAQGTWDVTVGDGGEEEVTVVVPLPGWYAMSVIRHVLTGLRPQKAERHKMQLRLTGGPGLALLRAKGLLPPRGSPRRSFPQLLRRSPVPVVAAFLRALFESNGYVSRERVQVRMKLPTQELAMEAAALLAGLGVPALIRTAGSRQTGPLRAFEVRIPKAALPVWMEKVGCDAASPVSEAHRLLHTLRVPRRRPEPVVPGVVYMPPGEPDEVTDPGTSPREHWEQTVQEVRPAGVRPTLDLEVEGVHAYLAYGIVTHNSRRGANMAVLRVDHPDIEEFITCKTSEEAIRNFNISVGVTDAFMRAVEEDEEFELVFPDVTHPAYRNFRGSLEDARERGIPIRVYRKVRARDLFDKIARAAHRNGEPGVLFLDTINRANPVPAQGRIEATNPCAEQPLLPYENCCLGSVNLARHLTPEGRLDWEGLAETVRLGVRFLDDVVQANRYVPAIPELRQKAMLNRRIGLGITGLADVFFALGIRYGSPEAQDFVAQLMEFIRYHAMLASIDLARERGPFPAIRESIYNPEEPTWEPPRWPAFLGDGPRYDWGRPPVDWARVLEGIRRYGIRNAAQTTIPPTGTTSTVAGVEGYGCEPVFALAYWRHVYDAEGVKRLRYVSRAFQEALRRAGLSPEEQEAVIRHVLEHGTVQNYPGDLPPDIRDTFVVALDIPPEEHVRMQAAAQAFVDSAISKTINFPPTATVEDVKQAYLLAWKLGCKGLTVYVAGSRKEEVLTTADTDAKRKEGTRGESGRDARPTPHPLREVPEVVAGVTATHPSPLGTLHVTLNRDDQGQPLEVFLNLGRAGAEAAAIAEALGRLISVILRLNPHVEPEQRLGIVIDQLKGLGGTSIGFGPNGARSLPDAVARALEKARKGRPASAGGGRQATVRVEAPGLNGNSRGHMDLCPQCQQATLVVAEGCGMCRNCGYSRCS